MTVTMRSVPCYMMYLCLHKVAHKVWKKNCANFLYTKYKAGRKSKSFFQPFLAVFPSLVMHWISSFNGVPGTVGESERLLDSKEHLDWLEIDLNVAEIITVQDYKHKKIEVNGRTRIECYS